MVTGHRVTITDANGVVFSGKVVSWITLGDGYGDKGQRTVSVYAIEDDAVVSPDQPGEHTGTSRRW